jgi:hypothetical protein
MNTSNTARILTSYEIVKETEKAIQVATEFIVGRNYTTKLVWMPKSATKVTEQGLLVASWLINKNESSQYRTYFNAVARDENYVILTVEFN